MFEFFFFQAEDGIRDIGVTGVQTCALPIWDHDRKRSGWCRILDARDRLSGVFREDLGVALDRVVHGVPKEDVALVIAHIQDRKSVVEGKSVDLGGRRSIKKKIIVSVVYTLK